MTHFPLFIPALISALLLLVGHYFPWRTFLRRELRQTEAYVYGVLGLQLPATLGWAIAGWSSAQLIAAFWAATFLGGGAVVLAYLADGFFRERADLQDERERARLLKSQK